MGRQELETFVVVHDQERLLTAEADGQYRHLSEPRFIIVGHGPTERLAGRDDVIVARELPENLENRPNLLAFTAWFAVSRNRLSRAAYVAMLEYDVDVTTEFADTTRSALRASPGALVGYVPMPLTDPRFGGIDVPFASSLCQTYGIDVDTLVANQLESTGYDLWTATSNLALSRRTLDAFVNWYMPLADTFGDDPLGAHVQERCIPIFGLLTGRETVYLPDVLSHRQARSHGIEVALKRHHPKGARRLPARAADPRVSVVVATRDDEEGLLRTLRSLSPERQADIDAGDFEVIVVDDGSQPPLDLDRILATGSNVRRIYRGSVTPDTVQALDLGVEMARGEQLGLIPSATSLASRGLVSWASRAVGHFESSLVKVPTQPTRPDSAAFDPGVVFCSRRRFVELGGVAGVSDLCRSPEAADDTTCVTLIGEAMSSENTREGDRDPGHAPNAADERLVYFGYGPPSTSPELDHARLEIADRETRIEQLLDSRSWRLTEPLRRLTSLVMAITRQR